MRVRCSFNPHSKPRQPLADLRLESAIGHVTRIIYVDSGSTDGSVGLARSMGVDVVVLDRSVKFTAARARNAGVQRLALVAP